MKVIIDDESFIKEPAGVRVGTYAEPLSRESQRWQALECCPVHQRLSVFCLAIMVFQNSV